MNSQNYGPEVQILVAFASNSSGIPVLVLESVKHPSTWDRPLPQNEIVSVDAAVFLQRDADDNNHTSSRSRTAALK